MAASSAARGIRSTDHTGQIVGMEDQENALAEKVKAGVYENGAERDMKLKMFNMGEDLKELLKRVRQQMFKREAGNEEGNKENDPLAGIDMMDADQLGSKLKALLNNKRYI
ncbi:uncharacterized protein [Lolium perenne]|uniref:uncharacterized protein n=1 Tax=Lolium perenne TaxID=4522 RepID=UPI003A98DE10